MDYDFSKASEIISNLSADAIFWFIFTNPQVFAFIIIGAVFFAIILIYLQVNKK